MGDWKETKHNYWIHSKGKYAITIYQRGNWHFKVEDIEKGRQVTSVYLALKKENDARTYMQNLLFINQDVDNFVKMLQKR